MAKRKSDKDDWPPVRPGITSDIVRTPGLTVVENGRYRHFKSYWELLDWLVHRSFDISVNSPEEYDVLGLDERKKLDGVFDAWFPEP